jgi:hypothetical protein
MGPPAPYFDDGSVPLVVCNFFSAPVRVFAVPPDRDFTALFRCQTTDHLVRECGTIEMVAILREWLVGVTGIGDAAGRQLRFSPELRERLLRDQMIFPAICDALREAMAKICAYQRARGAQLIGSGGVAENVPCSKAV